MLVKKSPCLCISFQETLIYQHPPDTDRNDEDTAPAVTALYCVILEQRRSPGSIRFSFPGNLYHAIIDAVWILFLVSTIGIFTASSDNK